MQYRISSCVIASERPVASFATFQTQDTIGETALSLHWSPDPLDTAHAQLIAQERGIAISAVLAGWMYAVPEQPAFAMQADKAHASLTVHVPEGAQNEEKLLQLLRTALECRFAFEGQVSLHSACVELEGKTVCFTGPSGTGKSTRAQRWVEDLGAEWLSGDRPGIRLTKSAVLACGMPWDGKEKIYRNAAVPLLAICDIRRSETVRVRRLSPKQARQVLMQQCFVPMWDPDAAAAVMMNVRRLIQRVPVYRLLCGPDEASAREAMDILYNHPEKILKEEIDMKAKKDFVLRNIVDEYIVMPTGANIGKFDGAVVLNEVSAFLWEKLQTPVSREELLTHLLAEYDVDEATAARDLDNLLDTLRGYDMLEEDMA